MSITTSPKRVFILGAGFSKAAGFPLATELTDEVLDALRKRVREDHELFKFADHVSQLHRWITRSNTLTPLNIEEFYDYASVYIERLRMEQHCATVGRDAGETPWTHSTDLRTSLSHMDRYLINVILEYEDRAELDVVDRFVACLGSDDALITFNYDRLIERCLSNRGTPWSFWTDENQHTGRIPVLKMHGSLDWICLARDQSPQQHGLIPLYSKKDANRERAESAPIRTGENEYDFELFHIKEDDRLRKLIKIRSLIQYDHYWGLAGLGPLKRPSLVPGLGFVWAHARRVLFNADEIVIVGFSFSGYDRLAQIEFARVMAGRDENSVSPPRIVVIDPALQPVSGDIPPDGQALIARIENVFRPVEPIGKFHEDFDWKSLSETHSSINCYDCGEVGSNRAIEVNDLKQKPLRDTAREFQHKLAFYTVALAFTVLALSIETFKLKITVRFDYFVLALELLAWLAILASGIAGLLWLNWIQRHFHVLAGREEGLEYDPEDNKKARERAAIYQLCHHRLLMIGIVFLVLSRAIVAIQSAF